MLFQLSVVRLFVSCLKELEDNPMEVLLTHPYVDIVCKIVLQQTGELRIRKSRDIFGNFGVENLPILSIFGKIWANFGV